MNDADPKNTVVDRDLILAELARREGGQQGPPFSDAEESTIRDLAAGLDTLTEALGQPPPLDEFAEESDCRRATEWVERLTIAPGLYSPEIAADRIGPYEIVGQVGQGGMGAVLKAVHTKLHREVALKVLPAGSLESADTISRFEREMAAVGALRHPNIVTAHDAGEMDGMHYLVMEYVDGVDLSTLVRQVGPLAPADACEIVRQAACGLAEAHGRGIVHRDVKPSNIMLSDATTADGAPTVKVLDFGLALLAPRHAGDRELTSAGQIMGTLNYMAPEQCSESHTVDERADVYSLGATLYRLLSGRPPFGDDRFASPMSLISSLASEPPTPLAELGSDLPPQLNAIVERMMAKNPADRFDSADKIAEVLAPHTVGANLGPLLKTASERSVDEGVPWHVKQAAPAGRRIDRRERSAWKWTLSLGVAAVVAVAAALVAWRSAGRWSDLSAIVSVSPPGAQDRVAQLRSRRAAEWLSAQRATYGIGSDETGYVEVTTGLQPPTYPFLLETVDLAGNLSIRDEDLEQLSDLPELTLIQLADTNIGDEGLRNLRDLPQLIHLFLSSSRVSDMGLGELRRFGQLETLYLTTTAISDAGLEHVASLQNLKELSLAGCRITDEGLKHLESLRNLETLWITDTQVTPQGIARLHLALPNCRIDLNDARQALSAAGNELPTSDESAFRKSRSVAEWLSSLGAAYGASAPSAGFIEVPSGGAPPEIPFLLNTVNLGQIKTARDEDLTRFDSLPTFVTLVLNDTDIGDAGLRNLGHLPALDHLYLSGTRVTDAGLAELKRFPKLTTLHLYGTAVTNAGLQHLTENQNLTELQLVGCLISDEGIDHLKQLRSLKVLYLQNTAVTARGVAQLRLALPDCGIESSFKADEVSAALEELQSGNEEVSRRSRSVAEWLSSQRASYGVSDDEDGYREVSAGEQPPASPFRLVTAGMIDNRQLTDEDLQRFDDLPHLGTFVLTGTSIGDEGLRNLGDLPALTQLYLANTQITDAGLEELKRFPRLHTVHLNGTDVSDAGLVHMAQIECLIELELIACQITDAGLQHLRTLRNLEELQIGKTTVTARGIAQLQSALPTCEIRSDFSDEEIAAAGEDLQRQPRESNW